LGALHLGGQGPVAQWRRVSFVVFVQASVAEDSEWRLRCSDLVVILFVVEEGRKEVGMQVLKSFTRKRLDS